jgi:hypothetical protein
MQSVTPDPPIIGKIGHAHAGYGKIKLKSAEEISDFRSVVALHGVFIFFAFLHFRITSP